LVGIRSQNAEHEPEQEGRLDDHRWVESADVLLLAVPDAAAHAALLAPHLATSFASSTTGHAFSSGVWGRVNPGGPRRIPGVAAELKG
jgi:hypothetical protein